LKEVRTITSLDVKRADFKLDMLNPHLFMNFRVVDEHGRQLGHGRNLGSLKAELGPQARGAFQALAGLKGLLGAGSPAGADDPTPPTLVPAHAIPTLSRRSKQGRDLATPGHGESSATLDAPRYTAWDFGVLPELMEIRQAGQTLIGYPALIDHDDAVGIEVFDLPEVALAKHRAGLRRLFALQIRDALKYLEKNIPDLNRMAVAYMPLGTLEELRSQIVDLAIDRAFLIEPLPASQVEFQKRLDEGRGRLTLIANEIARLVGVILMEYAQAARKIKDTRNAAEATADCAQQLQRLLTKSFLLQTPWLQLQHLPRYLKAMTLRLDKFRADPARDAARLAELRPLEQRFWRLVAERKGLADGRLQEFRWMLEELRVSFFAQELRTPQPVSLKRLDKAWIQLMG
ncbi:MAG: DUF3418 domain-containing protein, partial [Hylemonella sp.]